MQTYYNSVSYTGHMWLGNVLVMFLMLCCACQSSESSRRPLNKAKFSTSDASEIYFRNIRQVSYDKNTLEEAKLDIYRISSRNTAEDKPVINLSIAINWRYDEAYILVEPNQYLQSLDTLHITWQDTLRQQQGSYTFSEGNKEEQFNFAVHLYQSIKQEHRLFLLRADGTKEAILHDRKSRDALRKTAYDYLRLVDLL